MTPTPPALPPARRRARIAALAFALVAAGGVASMACAETTDREKPINYSADTGDVNYQTKIGALNGNVVITQGTLMIRADKIVFRQNPDNSLSATAYGNPVSFRQKRDNDGEYYEGFAQRAEYDGSKELLELFDRALLKHGQDEIRSNYISYNASTEFFKAEGRAATTGPDPAGPGTRVRGMFQPKGDTALPGVGKARDKDAAKAAPKDATKDAPKDAAKDAPKSAPKDAAKTPPKPADPPAALKPAGELAPAAQ